MLIVNSVLELYLSLEAYILLIPSSMHFQIEYYNKLWKDWLAFDQQFYKTEKDAQKRIDEYKENVSEIKTRIIQTTILDEKPKKTRAKRVGRTVSVEKAKTTTWPH
jgi:ABC-type Fe2+-enterobactin transport system substrate-binding protein